MFLEEDPEPGEDVPLLGLVLDQDGLQHRAQGREVTGRLVVLEGLLEHDKLLGGEAFFQQAHIGFGLLLGALIASGGRRCRLRRCFCLLAALWTILIRLGILL
jgi:hypothetical protein